MVRPKDPRIENTFSHHNPNPSQEARIEAIRGAAKVFAQLIIDAVPESRERALAWTKLEECVMWANAGIARYENMKPEAQQPKGEKNAAG